MTVLNVLAPNKRPFPALSGWIDPAVTYPVAVRSHPVPAAILTGPGADPAARRLIAAHPALGTLSDLDRITLLQGANLGVLKRQDVICYQGDPAAHVVLVLEGFLKLSAMLADGSEVFVAIAGRGDCVGEILALQSREHDANATALSACRLLMIDARRFRQVFERKPEGLMALLRLADGRLQTTVERLLDSRARTAPVRLAKALQEVARLPGSGPDGSPCLPLRLSQSELGVMAGMSREMVNKHLATWRDAGWIRMSGGTVASVDSDALAAMSCEDIAC
jgi:CRP/FNR family transcriptional regulator, cyclic AMP receptor protein